MPLVKIKLILFAIDCCKLQLGMGNVRVFDQVQMSVASWILVPASSIPILLH